jgi:triosephosphate isomerase
MIQAGKSLYLVGNWKSNKTWEEAREYLNRLHINSLGQHKVVLCPPFPYLVPMAQLIKDKQLPVLLGTQDLSPFPFGAYTGAVTGAMVAGYASYAIVGHSERRKYFHETNQDVWNKARTALDNNVTPIVCVDEPYMEAQLVTFTKEELKRIVVAYEPLSAIGSGKPDTPEHANAVADRIHWITESQVPVLYGGSVTADSVRQFVEQPLVSGVLVGSASLDPDSWSRLVMNVGQL